MRDRAKLAHESNFSHQHGVGGHGLIKHARGNGCEDRRIRRGFVQSHPAGCVGEQVSIVHRDAALAEHSGQHEDAGAVDELAENRLAQGRLFNQTWRFPEAIRVLYEALAQERNSVTRASIYGTPDYLTLTSPPLHPTPLPYTLPLHPTPNPDQARPST